MVREESADTQKYEPHKLKGMDEDKRDDEQHGPKEHGLGRE